MRKALAVLGLAAALIVAAPAYADSILDDPALGGMPLMEQQYMELEDGTRIEIYTGVVSDDGGTPVSEDPALAEADPIDGSLPEPLLGGAPTFDDPVPAGGDPAPLGDAPLLGGPLANGAPSVPEPASVLLVVLGAAGLGAARRRRGE